MPPNEVRDRPRDLVGRHVRAPGRRARARYGRRHHCHLGRTDARESDAAVAEFLNAQAALRADPRLSARVAKLGSPPYTQTALFQLRARLIADLGGVERGRTFRALLRDTLIGLARTYGPIGAVRSLLNMSIVQRTMLPQSTHLDLHRVRPQLAVPVHFVCGNDDPLVTAKACVEAAPLCRRARYAPDPHTRRGAHGPL